MTLRSVSIPLLALSIALVFSLSSFAAEEPVASWSAPEAQKALDEVGARLSAEELNETEIADIQQALRGLERLAERCVADHEAELERLNAQLEVLAPEGAELTEKADTSMGPPQPESQEIERQRRELLAQRNEVQARLQACQLGIVRIDDLLRQASAEISRLSAQRLFRRDVGAWGLLGQAGEQISTWPKQISNATKLEPAIEGEETALRQWVLLGAAFGFLIGLLIRYYFFRWYWRNRKPDDPPQLRFLIPYPLAKHAPVLLVGLSAALVLFIFSARQDLDYGPLRIAVAVVMFGIGRVLIDWSTGPLSPSARIKGLVPEFVKPIRNRLNWLLVASLLAFVVRGPAWMASPLEETDLLIRTLLTVILAVPLLSLLLMLGRVPGIRGRYVLLRLAFGISAAVALLAELLGYYNLATYFMAGVIRTAFVVFVLWMLLWAVDIAGDWLIEGGSRAAYRVRTWLGIDPLKAESGVGWLRLILHTALWLTFFVYLIYVWEPTGNFLQRLATFLTEGITIGDWKVVPNLILGGLFAFMAILFVTRWLKRWIQRRWIRQTTMDRGTREALVTTIGYVGFAIAFLLGLSIAGVDFTGLALIAGALSVGIGFGLQNIVNNFVSGLVLLYERPIKAGDFVSVGAVEGFVKKISIRSTEIQTLDRTNVIVPNSDLISGQVTNWVLHDPYGRLVINIGVAYGSDIETVQRILKEIADAHPEVVHSERVPHPKALFLRFGDSALEFELRAHIRRIEKRFEVSSEIHFAIDKAFREHGIHIPFPQRDLHMRTWDAPIPDDEPPEENSA